jgi:hypothetical protein
MIYKYWRRPLGWEVKVGRGFGFENLDGQFSDLVEQHCFDILWREDLGFVEGFVVGVTEKE